MKQELHTIDLPAQRRSLARSQRTLRIGLGAALLILLLLVALPPLISVWATGLRERQSSQIQAFEDIRLQVENAIQSMQAASRGYLITQESSFLEAYGGAAVQIPGNLERLQSLAGEVDPVLVPKVDELRQRIERWQSMGPDKQIELIRQDNLAAAAADISSGQSQQRFDAALEQLRLLNTEIIAINRNLTAWIGQVRAFETGLSIGLGGLGVVLGGYLIRVFGGLSQQATEIDYQRQRAEQAVIETAAANAEVQRQLDESRRRNAQLSVLNRVAGRADAPLQTGARAQHMLDEMIGALGLSRGAIWEYDAVHAAWPLLLARGGTSADRAQPSMLAQHPLARALAGDQPMILARTDRSAWAALDAAGELFGSRIESALALPLHGRSGQIGGMLLVAEEADQFRGPDMDYYRALASEAGLTLENAVLYEAVLREEQRLQVIFDQSPEGIVFAEAPGGRIVLANQIARMLLDDPLPGGHPIAADVLARMYKANGQRFAADDLPLQRALKGEARIGVELTIEQTSGQRVPVLFNCVPLRDADGQLQGAVAVFQDLSHFREVERLKSDFVAMVSHELRTPLTAIQGCVQALLHGPGRAEPQRVHEFLEIIATQSARLHDLIDNLLDMSQLEAGAFRLRSGSVQPAQLLRNVARQIGERIADVTLQVDLPQPLPTISADERRLEQVLTNLIDNARKFSPRGGIITLRADLQPDRVQFSVRDQGPGVAPGQRERIFERFFQGAPPLNQRLAIGGTGLGLAICKAIVEAHGGEIWVDEAVSSGTRICFTLPRLPEDGQRANGRAPAAAASLAPTGSGRVLVVDDEPSIRQMLEGSLRGAGYSVISVAEGQAAIEQIAAEQPDLVVLDVMLPGQDGFEVLKRIRDWSSVMVLMLTASAEPNNVVRGLQLGADDYLSKPFNINELLARIEALLRRRQGSHEPGMPPIVQRGPLVIDMARRSVQVDHRAVDLTPTEFRLLAYFAQHPGQVLTHSQILQHVWGPEYGGENQYLWVHIGRLRQKIESDAKDPRIIVTERGVGYRMNAE